MSLDAAAIAKFKVAELKVELVARGLDNKGKKPELAERLTEAVEAEASVDTTISRRTQITLRFTQLRDTLNQEMESDHPTESSARMAFGTWTDEPKPVPDTLSSSKRLQQVAQLKEWMDACETIDV